jgi:outer membrane protein assembly factor BamA
MVALLGAACREEGTIQVKKLAFEGTKMVDEGRLKAALATKESSWIPWGPKKYFDRSRFDADLKRIQAFYVDRGFPDARVQSVDVQLNDKKDAVSVTVHVFEGEPVMVQEVRFEGLEVLPEWVARRLRRNATLKAGEPLDRQAFGATREAALNEFRDRGYPYATVETEEQPGSAGPRHVIAVYRGRPGAKATFGPIEIAGQASVSEDVIRRQLTFKPGDLYRRSQLQESQSRLYNLELFEFANVEPLAKEEQPPQVPTRVTVAEGKHRRLNFGVGYGSEEKARVPRELFRRRAHGRRLRAVVVARSRGEGGSHPAVLPQAPPVARLQRAGVEHARAVVLGRHLRRASDVAAPGRRARAEHLGRHFR